MPGARAAHVGRECPPLVLFTGQLLLGWGLFDLVEGLVDHHVPNLHHARDLPAHVPMYDWLFLAIGGVGFRLLGWATSGEPQRATAR